MERVRKSSPEEKVREPVLLRRIHPRPRTRGVNSDDVTVMELISFRAGKLLPRNVILDLRQQQILDDERSAQDLVFGVVNNGHPALHIRIWIHHDAQTIAATGDVPFALRDLRASRVLHEVIADLVLLVQHR